MKPGFLNLGEANCPFSLLSEPNIGGLSSIFPGDELAESYELLSTELSLLRVGGFFASALVSGTPRYRFVKDC